jgi:hypothetical protein
MITRWRKTFFHTKTSCSTFFTSKCHWFISSIRSLILSHNYIWILYFYVNILHISWILMSLYRFYRCWRKWTWNFGRFNFLKLCFDELKLLAFRKLSGKKLLKAPRWQPSHEIAGNSLSFDKLTKIHKDTSSVTLLLVSRMRGSHLEWFFAKKL